VAEPQPSTKTFRIMLLTPHPAPQAHTSPSETLRAFRQARRDLGYVRGENAVIEERFAAGSTERLREYAAEAVRLPVGVIVAIRAVAIRAAAEATTTIPIVGHDLDSDPVASGFVADLARPGGNVTGVFLDLPELSGKALQLLKEAIPGMRRHAIGYADKILEGAKPGDLPVQRPARFTMVINLRTARALGLTIPPALVLRADHIVE
jgi:ABC-type uncharacterized transport system substrate-binding protein